MQVNAIRGPGISWSGCVRAAGCGRIALVESIGHLQGGAMKAGRVLCVVALSLLWPVAAVTQSAFEPLDRWKAAILAGNVSELDALYSRIPPTRTQTPQGTTEDIGEEPHFWSALAASGLGNLDPKILEIQHVQ